MNRPIESLMNKESQLMIAKLQDSVIDIIFSLDKLLLHGGTAIWRCYGGGRFSNDIDIYISNEKVVKRIVNRISLFGERIVFNRKRKKILYYDISADNAKISLQIKISNKKGILVSYEKIDGNRTQIFSMTPENLIIEKIETYNNRALIRDIYDIMILTRSVLDKSRIVDIMISFLSNIKKPKDEKVLKDIVYNGPVPTFEDIVEYLWRWCKI